MNLSSVAGNRSKRKDLLFFNFNQDASCFSAGTTEGVRVYNCDPFRLAFEYTEGGGCGIAEMLFCTSLVALVGSGDQPTFSPRKLRILNTATEQTICELPFVSSILAVKLNKKRMAVVMETKIHLYDISTMRILHTLDTATNSEGLVALSPDNRSHLAFPGTKGDVLLYDALNLASLNVIERAHKGSISFLAFNEEGTLLATASNKGTVVRVFAVPGGHKVCEFRRGSYAARIYSLAFSRDSSFLCVTSDTGTAHIYKIEKASLVSTSSGSHASTSSSSFMSAYLPEMVSDLWQPERSFASVKLPSGSNPAICAISDDNEELRVVTSEGYFYQYQIPSSSSSSEGGSGGGGGSGLSGGTMKMIQEATLFETQSEEVSTAFLS